VENERLTPQRKLELLQGMIQAKNIKEYAEQVGLDRGYLYELRREMEQASLDTWSKKAIGRPPQPAPQSSRNPTKMPRSGKSGPELRRSSSR
jgi:hypothetical protein